MMNLGAEFCGWFERQLVPDICLHVEEIVAAFAVVPSGGDSRNIHQVFMSL
jgi:hypothetical protein